MAKAKIIKECVLGFLIQNLLENIEKLDAEIVALEVEIVVLEIEIDQEKRHNQNERHLQGMKNREAECYAQRDAYHQCLCEIQRNTTEVEI